MPINLLSDRGKDLLNAKKDKKKCIVLNKLTLH